MTAPEPAGGTNVAAGIGWMLVTAFLFITMDTMAKWLSASVPVLQIVWARYAFHAFFLALWLGPRLPKLVASRRPRLQLLRSVLLLATTGLFYLGLTRVPLVDASAILFLSPILVTALSVPLLGERVGPRRWIGVLIGFLGVVIVIRPGMGVVQLWAVLPLAAAASNAVYQIMTRQLSAHDSTMTTLIWSALVGGIVSTLTVPFVWRAPTSEEWILLILVGLFGLLSHFALIRAFRAAPPAIVVPFHYSTLVWAVLYGVTLFGEVPDAMTLVGATVIVASGLYVFHREQRAKEA